MTYIIRIKRQENCSSESYWQEFEFDGNENTSIAVVLNELNSHSPLVDKTGKEVAPIAWECGCMVCKCGACAMRINGVPRLACSTFLSALKGKRVILEPLSKFPLVQDLMIDRSAIFEKLEKLNIWLESEAYISGYTHAQRYQSARCLMCGCCLEICPNFSTEGDFAGAIAPVNAYRILNEEQDSEHFSAIATQYKQNYFEGCGKSLVCQNICPAGIPVEELMVRSNAAAIWKK
ncbi:MAG: succinate dehydrogenase/fumarate reductase iron-sulfur subunit [Roseburia sp.]